MITATDQAQASTIAETKSEDPQTEPTSSVSGSASSPIQSGLASALEARASRKGGNSSSTARFSPESIEKIIRAIAKLVEAFTALAQAYAKSPAGRNVSTPEAQPQAPKEHSESQPEALDNLANIPPETPPIAEAQPDGPSDILSSEPTEPSTATPAVLVDRGQPLERTSGFLWKPESDKDGKLAILLPPHLTGKVKSVAILSPDGSRTLQSGKYAGNGNGQREHFRFSKPGGAFPDGSIVLIKLEDGSRRYVKIGETSARVQK